MIQREFYTQRKDDVKLYRTYSDAGMMIRQNETGAEYAEAVDVADAPYTYTETETKITEDGAGGRRRSARPAGRRRDRREDPARGGGIT